MPGRIERKYFFVPFSFLGNALRHAMSQVLHVVFFVFYVMNRFVSLHLKHLLKDEMIFLSKPLLFSIDYKGNSLVCAIF